MIELTTKTMTADSRIGTSNAGSVTMLDSIARVTSGGTTKLRPGRSLGKSGRQNRCWIAPEMTWRSHQASAPAPMRISSSTMPSTTANRRLAWRVSTGLSA